MSLVTVPLVTVIFIIDFSMSNWLENMGIPSLEDLKDSAKTMLIQQLGVDKFLQDGPCHINDDLYSPSVNGWKNGKNKYWNKTIF